MKCPKCNEEITPNPDSACCPKCNEPLPHAVTAEQTMLTESEAHSTSKSTQPSPVDNTLKPKKQWFFLKDKVKYGPISMTALIDLIQQGKLLPETPISNGETLQWIRIRDAFKKRPTNLSVVSWFGIVWYALKALTVFIELGLVKVPESLTLLVASIIPIVLCVALHDGENWARVAFIWFMPLDVFVVAMMSHFSNLMDIIFVGVAISTLFGDRELGFLKGNYVLQKSVTEKDQSTFI